MLIGWDELFFSDIKLRCFLRLGMIFYKNINIDGLK